MENESKYISPERRAEIAQRKALYEKRKVFGTASMTQEDMVERDQVARLNRQALLALLREYPAIFIARKDFDVWRPTTREHGEVAGVWESVEILCTDGLLAWYRDLTSDITVLLCGHIQHFSGEVKPLFSLPKEAGKVRKPRQTLLAKALEFLQCNVSKPEQDKQQS